LELLAAANAAAAARLASSGQQNDYEDDYAPDNLSCLAAAAAAESESDAELARSPDDPQQVGIPLHSTKLVFMYLSLRLCWHLEPHTIAEQLASCI